MLSIISAEGEGDSAQTSTGRGWGTFPCLVGTRVWGTGDWAPVLGKRGQERASSCLRRGQYGMCAKTPWSEVAFLQVPGKEVFGEAPMSDYS